MATQSGFISSPGWISCLFLSPSQISPTTIPDHGQSWPELPFSLTTQAFVTMVAPGRRATASCPRLFYGSHCELAAREIYLVSCFLHFSLGECILPDLFIPVFSLMLSSTPYHTYPPLLPPGSHWGHSLSWTPPQSVLLISAVSNYHKLSRMNHANLLL